MRTSNPAVPPKATSITPTTQTQWDFLARLFRIKMVPATTRAKQGSPNNRITSINDAIRNHSVVFQEFIPIRSEVSMKELV